jgi:hypothetical protein
MQREAETGVTEDYTVFIEDADDIIADIDQAFDRRRGDTKEMRIAKQRFTFAERLKSSS